MLSVIPTTLPRACPHLDWGVIFPNMLNEMESCLKDRITVVCAYCKELIRIKDGNGISGISHGICQDCMEEVTSQIVKNPSPVIA